MFLFTKRYTSSTPFDFSNVILTGECIHPLENMHGVIWGKLRIKQLSPWVQNEVTEVEAEFRDNVFLP
jgi:hypothetical protein